MSEESSPSSPQTDAVASAVAAATAEITALLEQIRAKKAEFDSSIGSANSSISDETQKVQGAISQISGLREEFASSKAGLESDRGTVADLVEKAKASQREIDGIKTDVAGVKGATETIQQSAISDQGVISQSKKDIDALKSSATALSEKLAKDHEAITNRITDLQAEYSALQNVLKDISDAKSRADGDSSAVKNFLEVVESTRDRLSNLNSSSGEQYDALTAKQAALQDKISEIETANNVITALRQKLLEGSEGAKSVQDEVLELHTNISSVLAEVVRHRDESAKALQALTAKAEAASTTQANEWKDKLEKLYDSLRTQILSLLPTAGAAGLAWTYFDAKSRYAPTPFAASPGSSLPNLQVTLAKRIFGYNPLSWGATIFFYALFMGPLLLLIYGTYDLVRQIEYNHLPMPDNRIIALRFLIAVPLATLSTFGFASLRLYRKLYEQYNHKQRVMELYMSFKREIETNGDDEQKKKLITIMLDSVAEKAWQITAPDREEKSDESLLSLDKLAETIARAKAALGVGE
jgi:predicted  nucleic acid-binding Zn-ribbon protein